MFFRKRQSDEDARLGELDEILGGTGSHNAVVDGIRRALERDDLTDQDRADFEAALQRLQQQSTTE